MQPESELRGFRTYDPNLEPIAAKVMASERLDASDGLALYRSKDVLAVGWLANFVRERMHGDDGSRSGKQRSEGVSRAGG